MNSGGLKKFYELCRGVKSEGEFKQLCSIFFTHEELDSLGQRVNLVEALLAGNMTQREMAKELDVSIAKITRGSNVLKRVDSQFKAELAANLSKICVD